mgnify:CR=1 FL=1
MTTANTTHAGTNVLDNAFNSSASTIALIGRVLLAAMFVLAGFDKIGGFEGTAGYIGSVGLPFPEVLTVLTIAVEIGAGLALIVGFQVRIAALLLAGFTFNAAATSVTASLFPATSVAAGRLFFGDAVNRAQVTGLVIVIIGTITIVIA